MRPNWTTILLLPSAVAGNILEAAFAEHDTTKTPTPAATPASLNSVLSATHRAQESAVPRRRPAAELSANTASPTAPSATQTSPANVAQAPFIGRSYDPNPAFLPATPATVERREIVTGVAQGVAVTANAAATQVPSITTYWPQMEVNGVVTYAQVIYTQTFADIPDQLPSPGAGTIGYGTDDGGTGSSKEKRGEKVERNSGAVSGAVGSVKLGAVIGAAAVVGIALL